MKKQLLCGTAAGVVTAALVAPALAADLPVKAAPRVAAVPIPYSWNGCYVGGHVGWGRSKFNGIFFGDTDTRRRSDSFDGGLGGLQIGCDQHLNNTTVWGLVGDVSFMNFKSSTITGSTDGVDSLNAKLKLLASLRANLGMTVFNDRTLLFVTGGLGYASGKAYFSEVGGNQDSGLHKFGGVIGGGIRYAFTDNLIGGVEGLYYIFNADEKFNGDSDNGSAEIKNAFVVRATLDWKFK